MTTKITAMQYDVAEFLTNSDGASEILDVLDGAIDHIFGEESPTAVALKRYSTGETPKTSFDPEGTITAGYGQLDYFGFWEFQLPEAFVEKYLEVK
jgi:hypothetical protein